MRSCRGRSTGWGRGGQCGRGVGLAEEGQEELQRAGGDEGEGEGVAGVLAARESAEEDDG